MVGPLYRVLNLAYINAPRKPNPTIHFFAQGAMCFSFMYSFGDIEQSGNAALNGDMNCEIPRCGAVRLYVLYVVRFLALSFIYEVLVIRYDTGPTEFYGTLY